MKIFPPKFLKNEAYKLPFQRTQDKISHHSHLKFETDSLHKTNSLCYIVMPIISQQPHTFLERPVRIPGKSSPFVPLFSVTTEWVINGHNSKGVTQILSQEVGNRTLRNTIK